MTNWLAFTAIRLSDQFRQLGETDSNLEFITSHFKPLLRTITASIYPMPLLLKPKFFISSYFSYFCLLYGLCYVHVCNWSYTEAL